MTKQCTKCKQELPVTKKYFYIHKTGRDGLCSQCKKCCKEASAKWTKQNKKKHNKNTKRWRIKNKDYYKEYHRRWTKTIKGYLGVVWHHINQRCYDSKQRDYHRYGGRGIQNRFKNLDEFRDYVINTLGYDTYDKITGLEIDRINNDGHYEKGNIRFVTPKVNSNNKG